MRRVVSLPILIGVQVVENAGSAKKEYERRKSKTCEENKLTRHDPEVPGTGAYCSVEYEKCMSERCDHGESSFYHEECHQHQPTPNE